ncbi:MAG: hypothetical protein TREMPRED_004119 [Tremellales sp. Tagirdzhanova-0007]|nr:MAG: hypothetical protein TREMPRED_004119 [Tremellales sp. Tagirdzhanova-0007]
MPPLFFSLEEFDSLMTLSEDKDVVKRLETLANEHDDPGICDKRTIDYIKAARTSSSACAFSLARASSLSKLTLGSNDHSLQQSEDIEDSSTILTGPRKTGTEYVQQLTKRLSRGKTRDSRISPKKTDDPTKATYQGKDVNGSKGLPVRQWPKVPNNSPESLDGSSSRTSSAITTDAVKSPSESWRREAPTVEDEVSVPSSDESPSSGSITPTPTNRQSTADDLSTDSTEQEHAFDESILEKKYRWFLESKDPTNPHIVFFSPFPPPPKSIGEPDVIEPPVEVVDANETLNDTRKSSSCSLVARAQTSHG